MTKHVIEIQVEHHDWNGVDFDVDWRESCSGITYLLKYSPFELHAITIRKVMQHG